MHIRCPHCHNPIELVDDAELTDIECPSCGSSFNLLSEETATFEQTESKTIAHFELQEQVGVGAFGSVWRARDTQLDRTVAIKLPRKSQTEAGQTEQFLREARSTAQLNHPNIVTVHEVGHDKGQVFIVSDFIEGLPLSSWLTGKQPTFREAATLCAKTAEALHHAHEAGVVHRDLKPSNIMIDARGEPHIMDFGLAKRDAGEITMTVDGKVLGTPAYMSPEQARGEGHTADRSTDVYSLGVILFEMLTGEKPFRGDYRMLIHQVLNDETPEPRTLNAAIPRDLETICLKCLRKEPGKRYSTSGELGDDIRRWLNGEPVQARPIGALEKRIRWCLRHPARAGFAVSIVASAVLFVGLLVAVVYQRRLETANEELQSSLKREATLRRTAEEQRQTAEEAFRLARAAEQDAVRSREQFASSVYSRQLLLADSLRKQSDGSTGPLADQQRKLAQDVLMECDENRRHWEWYFVSRSLGPESPLKTLARESFTEVVFTVDGDRIGATSPRSAIKIWDAKARTEVLSIPAQGATQLCFSHDGKWILSVGQNADHVTVWSIGDGKQLFALKGHPSRISSLKRAENPPRFLTASLDGEVRSWSQDGKDVSVVRLPFDSDGPLHLSQDGTLVARIVSDDLIEVWDVETSRLISSIKGQKGLRDVRFSPDGKLLATIGIIGHAILSSTATGNTVYSFRLNGPGYGLAFSPDGKRLVAAADTASFGTAIMWDVSTGVEVLRIAVGSRGAMYAVAFDPKGDRIVCAGVGSLTLLDGRPIETKGN